MARIRSLRISRPRIRLPHYGLRVPHPGVLRGMRAAGIRRGRRR